MSRIHCLCFSINSPQFSSPFSIILEKNHISEGQLNKGLFDTYHASRGFLVSGHAQHALHAGFFSMLFGAVVDSIDLIGELEFSVDAELPIFVILRILWIKSLMIH